MKTVTGKLVTMKPISHLNAAKYISRLTSSDNKASAALDIFLHRATESFNNLVGLHKQLKGGEKTRSRHEGHRIDADAEAVGALGENTQGEKAEKRERKGKGKGLEVKNEKSPDGIAGENRKMGKKSEDFEEKNVENEVALKTEGSPDGDTEKKRKKKKKKGDEVKQEIEDGGPKNALVDGGNMETKVEEETKGEGGKKRKHREVIDEEVKNLDMADDQSGKKKKKKRKIEGEGK